VNDDRVDDVLKRADLASRTQSDEWEQGGRAASLRKSIMQTATSRSLTSSTVPVRPSRRRGVAIGLGIALIAGSTAAGYALVRSRPTTNPLAVGCHATLDREANAAILEVTPSNESIGLIGLCAQQWQSAFAEPAPAALVACVVDGGGTGVFPIVAETDAQEACESIGASTPSGGTPYAGLSGIEVRALFSALRSTYAEAHAANCAGVKDLAAAFASTLVESEANRGEPVVDRGPHHAIHRLDLSGWKRGICPGCPGS
jgi:hypothetical protein